MNSEAMRWLLDLDLIPADAEGLRLAWAHPLAAWLWALLILACIGQRYRLAPADQQVVKPEVGVTLLPDRAIRLQLLPARSAAET